MNPTHYNSSSVMKVYWGLRKTLTPFVEENILYTEVHAENVEICM